jgi:hypothetical protein
MGKHRAISQRQYVYRNGLGRLCVQPNWFMEACIVTDLRKAAEMALEALDGIHVGNMTPMAEENWNKAITALRKALAQEQTKCPRCGEVNPAEIHTCSPQVAQPKRKWVGLTDEEVLIATYELRDVLSVKKIIKLIEAKLKEKNT